MLPDDAARARGADRVAPLPRLRRVRLRDGLRLHARVAVLHGLRLRARAAHRGVGADGPRDGHHHGPRRRPRVRRRARADRGRRRRGFLPPRRDVGPRGAARGGPVRDGRRDDGHARARGLRALDEQLWTHRGQRGRHRGDVPPAEPRARLDGRARRRGQRDQGDHEGLLHRVRGAGVLPPLRRVFGRVLPVQRAALRGRGRREARGAHGRPAGRHDRLPVRGHGHRGRRPHRGRRRRRGPAPVRGAAGHPRGHGDARLRAHGGHRHARVARRDGQARVPVRARARVGRTRGPVRRVADGPAAPRRGGVGGLPRLRHGVGHPHGPLPRQRRRRLGQREEVHRAGELRRQELGRAQGVDHGRHRRRPAQGHGRALAPRRHQAPLHDHPRPRAPLHRLAELGGGGNSVI
mmetsp:Transcript_5896/g.20136  ORF Transcript_5896/g.20136 Transcript_5896/m.20136 type:complete len:407 (+) Transcript_5896:1313-2533(+)